MRCEAKLQQSNHADMSGNESGRSVRRRNSEIRKGEQLCEKRQCRIRRSKLKVARKLDMCMEESQIMHVLSCARMPSSRCYHLTVPAHVLELKTLYGLRPPRTAMLHVRMLSGEEVASIPVDELQDVKALKRRMSQQQGFPVRFRQRLFRCGGPSDALEDATTLDSPMDLVLVLLPCLGHL